MSFLLCLSSLMYPNLSNFVFRMLTYVGDTVAIQDRALKQYMYIR